MPDRTVILIVTGVVAFAFLEGFTAMIWMQVHGVDPGEVKTQTAACATALIALLASIRTMKAEQPPSPIEPPEPQP